MRFMMSQGFEVLAASAEGKEIDDVTNYEGCPHVVIPLTRTISPLKDMKSLLAMYRLIRRYKPDIIHTHTPKAGLIGMWASWLARTPIRLHTIAGMPLMETQGAKRRLLVWIEQLTHFFATGIYPNSRGLMDFYRSAIKKKSNKLKVIGGGSSNGIDTSFFQANEEIKQKAEALRNSMNIPDDALVFIFVGRLVRDKGIHELIRAFKSLADQHPHLHLLLLGDEEAELDPLDADVIEFMKNHARIHLAGWQNDIRPYLELSDALAFPSYREGFPNVPMQAGCFGLPSIVSNINGCNEIVVEGENGLIIPVKDEEALKTAMGRLIEDQALISKLGAKARAMIVERYDQKYIWNEILNEYRQLLQIHV